MRVLIEENSNPTNVFNAFNVDTPQRIADRNRKMVSTYAALDAAVALRGPALDDEPV